MKETLRVLRDIWRLARPYWFSEDRWPGRGLLAVIVSMSLGLVFLNVLFNKWNNAFYDTLQNHDLKGFYHQLGIFGVLAASYITVAVYQLYLRQMLQIRWRRWLTERYLGEWLGDKVYYGLQMRNGDTDNPDQRIADDIGLFIEQTLTLSLGFLESVVTLVSFTSILWMLSGTLSIALFGHALRVPGYMVWVAVVYAIVGTWLTKRVGHPLIRLDYDQQRYEADFRFSLVRLRENAEGVALYGGEKDEAGLFSERFGHVVRNWWEIMKRRKRLAWLTTGYGQLAVVFPFLAAAPRYFSGALQLGGLMQTASAFGNFQGALSWFVAAYPQLAQWKATADRLTHFTQAMDEARDGARTLREKGGVLVRRTGADERLRVRDVALDLPDGRPLLSNISFTLAPGGSLLVTGPSGAGKSTLVRAIAGLWPHGRGRIELPASGRMLFLPQKPYLPVGTLRAAVSYPVPAGGFDDEDVREALTACGLSRLAGHLDDARYWAQELSPGEQQRLAFARMLLQRQDWLFLDEASSALDEPGEKALYALLRERLPRAAILSVGHRGTLRAFHEHSLVLEPLAEVAGASPAARERPETEEAGLEKPATVEIG
ncbi:ABC transporter domain-containing protein [Desulfovibrio sp. X2]|uniref:ABC transporter ATP-binding protein/permease n=1 Tax=Desulfovibrio sp. X2 TaxID=941449 RepID=UPI000358A4B9|nr:ABC transporter ATP-binding protein/permease [Desulfovibrio sp. X2]EPR44281.1 ABC transporter domain-containing protein [Desulfovibrio sp. X2]